MPLNKSVFTASIASALVAILSAPSFAADAVSGATQAAPVASTAPVLEGVRTMAAKGGDALPENIDAVTSASVVPKAFRQTDYAPKGFTEEPGKKRVLFVLDDPRHESVTCDGDEVLRREGL